MSSLPVRDELGPTLPDLAAPFWRRVPRVARLALVAVLVLVVLAVLWRVVGPAADAGETSVVVSDPVAFNLRFGGTLKRVEPAAGASLALEDRVGGEVLQSFVVEPLKLPAYRGLAAGALPVYAESVKTRLASQYRDFTMVQEGRTRINEVPGYELIFAARSDAGRRVYGRWVMMLPDEPGAREGVTLELFARWGPRVPNADALGDQGQLKLPLRSFRFGTEAP
jgi:hypothetical protein